MTDGSAPERGPTPPGPVLARVACTAVIDAPAAKVDLFDWLRSLPEGEFQRCAPPDHKAVGYTVTDDGEPMSVMVESIGETLFVQHFRYLVAGRSRCRLTSMSDLLTPAGWTTCEVTWELTADRAGDLTTRCASTVTCHPTAAYIRFLADAGQRFDDAAASLQTALADHCQRETPRYATSVSRHANALY